MIDSIHIEHATSSLAQFPSWRDIKKVILKRSIFCLSFVCTYTRGGYTSMAPRKEGLQSIKSNLKSWLIRPTHNFLSWQLSSQNKLFVRSDFFQLRRSPRNAHSDFLNEISGHLDTGIPVIVCNGIIDEEKTLVHMATELEMATYDLYT
jgi:hypothetical protein